VRKVGTSKQSRPRFLRKGGARQKFHNAEKPRKKARPKKKALAAGGDYWEKELGEEAGRV